MSGLSHTQIEHRIDTGDATSIKLPNTSSVESKPRGRYALERCNYPTDKFVSLETVGSEDSSSHQNVS